jgi:arylsulfatase A-like enzyme
VNMKTGEHPFEIERRESFPNIFLISVDMIPPEVYRPDGFYTPQLHTPNIKDLFEDSVQFRNAFCTSPLCGPSRASYLTGRYTYITVNEERAHDGHEVELRPTDVIFPEYLKRVGYLTKHVGKCHVGTRKFMDAFGENDRPWNRWAPPITDDDDYLKYLRDRDIKPMRYKHEVRGLQQDRKSPGNSYGGWIEGSDGSPFPLEGTYPYYLGHLAAEKLKTAIHQSGGKRPIYFQLDFFAPHQPFMIPSAFEERAEELRQIVKLPAGYLTARERDFKASRLEPRIYQFYRKYWGLYNPDTARDYILCNLLQMEVLDSALGVFMDELKRSGLYDSSMIIFIGDHGEMNCEDALVDKGVYGHPKVVRVPLSVKMPGGVGESWKAGKPENREVGVPVSLLDIAPTVMEIAGVQPAERLDGESLIPFIEGKNPKPVGAKHASPLLFEAGWHVAPNPAIAIQWSPGAGELYMYTYNLTSNVDELYDLNDCERYRNLAFDEKHRDVKQLMIEKLASVLRADDRWRCYWHTFRVDKFHHLPPDGEDVQMFIPEGSMGL